MGFMNKLFGGGSDSKAEDAETTSSPWQKQLLAAKNRAENRHGFWEWENETAREVVVQLLTQATPSFGNGKVKELVDDEKIELRGVYDGAPIRFSIWMSFGSFWGIDMRVNNSLGDLDFQRDLEKIPKEKVEDDPWDEDEERRVFLGKGIFVEGYDSDIEEQLTNWSRLPESLREQILVDMESMEIEAVRSYGNEASLSVKPGLDELEDPVEYMLLCAKVLSSIKVAIEGAGSGAGGGGVSTSSGASHARTCGYCSSVFILSVGHNTCPNCGAPAN